MVDIKVSSKGHLTGIIEIPADKSISHRAVMLLSLAKGKSVIKNFSTALDPKSTLDIFYRLGLEYKFLDDKTLVLNSKGKLFPSKMALDCGNSGTTMRLASGILSGQNFSSVLIGDDSLSSRPMKRIIEPLTLMGADISSSNGHAPLKITGHSLKAIEYSSQLSSAQVKSAILLAGLHAEGKTIYKEPYQSRNHTELMLKYLGAEIESSGIESKICKSEILAKNIEVAGDISSAAFFTVAALIVPNSDIIIKNVGLNPTRTGIIDVVLQMGGDIQILDKREISGEFVGDLRVRYTESLKAVEIKGEIIPRLIDEIPIIAVLASQANGKTIVKNASDLRNKESDRIFALCKELKKIGVEIEELADGFIVNGKKNISGGCELDSYKDHRLAMSFYVAGLISQSPIIIKNFDCVNISMPEFIRLMNNLL